MTKQNLPDPLLQDLEDCKLTEEEEKQLLAAALERKRANLREKYYWQKVNQEDEVPELSADQLQKIAIRSIENHIDKFEVTSGNENILQLISWYFTSDPHFEKQGYSLKKGLMMYGPVGCGKTTMMRMFGLNPLQSYSLISCRHVAAQYTKQGYDCLHPYFGKYTPYASQNPFKHPTFGICFDDLGTESEKKNWGNSLNVMGEILLNRYDKLSELKAATHITTNLSGDQIEEYYGQRVRSRMREMFNLIEFDIKAPDLRR